MAAHLKDMKLINERTHPAKYKLAASTATFNHDFIRTKSLIGSFEKSLTATSLASFRASPTQTLNATYGSSSSELRNMPSLIRILLQKQTLTEDKQPPQGLVWRLKRTSTFFSKIFNEVLSNLLFPTHKLILVGSKSSNWKDH